jgi:hypothetical protein
MPVLHRLLPSTCLLLLLVSSLAGATAQRTFVASHGVDNPNCSIAAPCRNFAAAITATSSGGEIIVLDSAGYGKVTITKSVSIISPPGIYGGISVFSGNGITVNAPGATVVLRGLSINGQGGANGILFQQGSRLRIESCVVSKMNTTGIYHNADNAEMIVLDTISRDNGDTGVALVAKNASIVLDHVRSEHNVNAGFYIAPTPGSTGANATITDSLFAENGGIGIWADTVGGALTSIQVQRTILANNASYGFQATSAAALSYADVTLTNNTATSGIYLLGISPGGVSSTLSGNSVYFVVIDGTASVAWANSNSGSQLQCLNGGTLRSLGNNQMRSGAPCATYIVGGGV